MSILDSAGHDPAQQPPHIRNMDDLVRRTIAEQRAEIERLRTAIFNTINDLAHKKPNIKAIRSYMASVYNQQGTEGK